MLKNRLKILSVLFSVFYWMLAGFYFVTVRYFGWGKYAPPDLNYGELAGYAGFVGLSIGVLFGLLPLTNVLRFGGRRSFLSVVVTGTSYYVLFFVVVIFIASSLGNSLQFALSYVFSPDGLIVLFHLSMSSALYHFIFQINKKFGPGVLLEYTLGRYFAPKVEDRAFMFLDLKSSTHLAETLKHVSYSRLVQDCYAELTIPLIDYKGQVYQYVGDEVVVSWRMNRFFNTSYCYHFFYAFQKRLMAKRDYFVHHYGVCPQFKAGVHCGKVTAAEVGEIKTEIAYHGDVVNTASRIQNLCNQYEKQLLVSEALLERLPDKDHGLVSFVAVAELRGKETTTKIYTISNPWHEKPD